MGTGSPIPRDETYERNPLTCVKVWRLKSHKKLVLSVELVIGDKVRVYTSDFCIGKSTGYL